MELTTIPLGRVQVAPGFNPRQELTERELDSLTQSIARHGVRQPIEVRETPSGYVVVAGHRRLEASRRAGLESIPAVVRTEEATASEVLVHSIIENVQRQDLNPVEEAAAYVRLMGADGLTVQGIAEAVGVSQARVTRRLEILDLPAGAQAKLAAGVIDVSAVKPLAALARQSQELCEFVVKEAAKQPHLAAQLPKNSLGVAGAVVRELEGGGKFVSLPGPVAISKFKFSEAELPLVSEFDRERGLVNVSWELGEQAVAAGVAVATAESRAIVYDTAWFAEIKPEWLKLRRQSIADQYKAAPKGEKPPTKREASEAEKQARRKYRADLLEYRKQAQAWNDKAHAALVRDLDVAKESKLVLELLSSAVLACPQLQKEFRSGLRLMDAQFISEPATDKAPAKHVTGSEANQALEKLVAAARSQEDRVRLAVQILVANRIASGECLSPSRRHQERGAFVPLTAHGAKAAKELARKAAPAGRPKDGGEPEPPKAAK